MRERAVASGWQSLPGASLLPEHNENTVYILFNNNNPIYYTIYNANDAPMSPGVSYYGLWGWGGPALAARAQSTQHYDYNATTHCAPGRDGSGQAHSLRSGTGGLALVRAACIAIYT